MPSTPNRPHALYRFYDAAGALLYVGITLDPGARWRQHQADKTWWTEVARIAIEPHPDRLTVLEAERAAIIAEHPRYNVTHNRRHKTGTAHLQCDHVWVEPNRRGDLVCCDCGHQMYGGCACGFLADKADCLDVAFSPAWGQRAEHMPDECHDQCARAGILSIYYPYSWGDGLADNQCANGHAWTCGWGHKHSGTDEQWRAVRAAGPWESAVSAP